MSDIELQVGKRYRTRHGRDVKIVKQPTKDSLYFQSDHFTLYRKDGTIRHNPKGYEDRWDIISEVSEPVAPMLINNGCDS